MLAVFNVAIFFGIGFVMDRRTTRGLPLHALLLGCAVFAAATPLIADAGASSAPLGSSGALRRAAAIATAVLAQAGLWAQTHLVTGALLDAIRGRRPTRRAALWHAREGLAKGAVFGGCFMALIEALALAQGAASGLRGAPLLGAALAGAAALSARADHHRKLRWERAVLPPARRERAGAGNVLRGLVVGSGLGLAAARRPAARERPANAPASACWWAPRPTRGSTCSAMRPPSRAAGAGGSRR